MNQTFNSFNLLITLMLSHNSILNLLKQNVINVQSKYISDVAKKFE